MSVRDNIDSLFDLTGKIALVTGEDILVDGGFALFK